MIAGHFVNPTVIYSDRGSQFAPKGYRDVLVLHELRCSMEHSGNPCDNVKVDSFIEMRRSRPNGVHIAGYDSLKNVVADVPEVHG